MSNDRREAAYDDSFINKQLRKRNPQVPETDLQAIMEAPPGESILESKESKQGMINAVKDAVDRLDDEYRYCIEAIQYEQLTFEELGKRLGVSAPHAWRLTQKAYEELAKVLKIDDRLSHYL